MILDSLSDLAHGVVITLSLTACSLCVGLLLALLLTLGLLSRRVVLITPIQIFLFFIRGTPLLVQIFLIYYGSAQFDWLKASPLWVLFRDPFACAVMALAFNTSAYTTVLLKGAIDSVPSNEVIACEAMGMSRLLMFRRIILPRAIRIALPAYSNEVIMVLKGTSLASTITLLDLMGVTNQIIARTYATIPYLLVAGVIYLSLNALLVTVFRKLEFKANRYLRV
ncbi:MAG: ABC transporter permease subunit [Gammaproteobacteria bacterium]